MRFLTKVAIGVLLPLFLPAEADTPLAVKKPASLADESRLSVSADRAALHPTDDAKRSAPHDPGRSSS